MSEWQAMSTAPADVNVEVGVWSGYGDRIEWKTATGVAFTKRFFGIFRTREYCGGYSHWRHLPPPPVSEATPAQAKKDEQAK